MDKRMLVSERTRKALRVLIEGRLSGVDAGTELIRLATRLIIEEALEAEGRDALGREYYEFGAEKRSLSNRAPYATATAKTPPVM